MSPTVSLALPRVVTIKVLNTVSNPIFLINRNYSNLDCKPTHNHTHQLDDPVNPDLDDRCHVQALLLET